MNCTLLVIDDNKSVRDALRFLLERRGYQVMTAENGPDGLALAEQNAIDGALIDVNMPGMNGIAVCRAMTTMTTAKKGRALPVWMMTGARTPELTKAAIEAGARVLMAKPFDFAELFRMLDEAIGPVDAPKREPDVLDQL